MSEDKKIIHATTPAIAKRWEMGPNEMILCTYKGVVDGNHTFVPISDGEIEVKFKTVISYCPHCGEEIKIRIEV